VAEEEEAVSVAKTEEAQLTKGALWKAREEHHGTGH